MYRDIHYINNVEVLGVKKWKCNHQQMGLNMNGYLSNDHLVGGFTKIFFVFKHVQHVSSISILGMMIIMTGILILGKLTPATINDSYLHDIHIHVGVSIHGDIPMAGWVYFMENPIYSWVITRGTLMTQETSNIPVYLPAFGYADASVPAVLGQHQRHFDVS